MITLKSTDNNGVTKEMTFSSEREAANALRNLFGDAALQSEEQHIRNETNAALRAAYSAKKIDPVTLFRRGENQSD